MAEPSVGAGRGEPLHVVGAGPAGLAAAITAARAGARVLVHERAASAGSRFDGDFQGLENWTTEGDVRDELDSLGIAPDFAATPFRELTLFSPGGGEHRVRSPAPLFYLVRRGSSGSSLDLSLVEQAGRAGVEVRFGDPVRELPEGGIVAAGPHVADVIASGWLFDTALADGAWAAVGAEVAGRGYAYLLVCGGRATLAVCLFSDFRRDETYLERARELFEKRVGFRMGEARRFGGAGNVRLPESAARKDLLYAGEAAGFQDPLWGFGMRAAMRSGHLAARAWLAGDPRGYDGLWRRSLAGGMRAGVVNRFLYEVVGDPGYRRLCRALAKAPDPRAWLRRRYARSWLKDLVYPLLKNAVLRPFERPAECSDEHCRCTWCRCVRGVALPEKGGLAPLEARLG